MILTRRAFFGAAALAAVGAPLIIQDALPNGRRIFLPPWRRSITLYPVAGDNSALISAALRKYSNVTLASGIFHITNAIVVDKHGVSFSGQADHSAKIVATDCEYAINVKNCQDGLLENLYIDGSGLIATGYTGPVAGYYRG